MSTTKWKLDPAHSEVTFRIKHMMITNVTGHFTDFNVQATSEDDDFTKGSASFSAKATSVNTNADQRDTHLRSAEFFDAEKYPDLKFQSKKLSKSSGDHFKLEGDLTIKDVTKPITLD